MQPVRLALALLLLIPACALAAQAPRTVNLDGDPEPETVLQRAVSCFGDGAEHPPPCGPDDAVTEEQATVVDVCSGAERRFDLLSEPYNRIDGARVIEADGNRSRPELLVEGRSGAAGYIGEVALVRLQDGGQRCARPRSLFRHPGPRARTRRPGGASYSTAGFVRARDYRRAVRGLELRLDQSWYRRGDAGCCPTWISTRFFRYDTSSDRYVPYRSMIRRLPRR